MVLNRKTFGCIFNACCKERNGMFTSFKGVECWRQVRGFHSSESRWFLEMEGKDVEKLVEKVKKLEFYSGQEAYRNDITYIQSFGQFDAMLNDETRKRVALIMVYQEWKKASEEWRISLKNRVTDDEEYSQLFEICEIDAESDFGKNFVAELNILEDDLPVIFPIGYQMILPGAAGKFSEDFFEDWIEETVILGEDMGFFDGTAKEKKEKKEN